MSQIPLNYQASAGETNKQVRSTLPREVVQCLDNARFLNLATCNDNIPHVSLMSYTYIPTSPYSTAPVIVMTTNPSSKKVNNIVANPIVSLLVHEWTYRRLPTDRRPSGGSPAPESRGPGAGTSSLVALLQNLNISSISAISAAINGKARLPESGSDEEAYYRRIHLENNTFDSDSGAGSGFVDGEAPSSGPQAGDSGRFVEGEEVQVIVVDIRDVRISDFKGQVRDWVLLPEGGDGPADTVRVNGISGAEGH